MNPAGTWYNELKSSMTITVNGGLLTGSYHNAAGPAKGDYDLSGVIDPDDTLANRTIAWVVHWKRKGDGNNFNSVTAWSGQLQLVGDDKKPAITAEWLLTSSTDPSDDWTSTKVGQDIFTQDQPPAELVEFKTQHITPSHPRE